MTKYPALYRQAGGIGAGVAHDQCVSAIRDYDHFTALREEWDRLWYRPVSCALNGNEAVPSTPQPWIC
ncbi:MAG: hypothetical protein L0H73_17965 [Nitrococcus sp.]|nr:hypothetical protein [Nitrococcus sp.]